MGKMYESLDDLDRKSKKKLKSILHDGETFQTAILGKVNIITRVSYCGTGLYARHTQKLILTDRRVIAYKRGWIREQSNDFALDEITSVEYTKGMFTGKITFQGAGYEETYRTFPDSGREFSTKVTERLQQEEEPLVSQG